MAGRPSKPRHIKEQQGTLRKCREVDNHLQLTPLSRLPETPTMIRGNDDAIEYFEFVCAALLGKGLLMADFVPDITRAAFWWSRFKEAVREIENKGVTQKAKTGWEQVSAWFTITEKAQKYLKEFEDRYGLNLVASQKISAPIKEKGEDDFD